MPVKRSPGRTINESDVCTPEFVQWCKDEFPDLNIDAQRTWAAFYDICDGNGYEYRNYIATCRNWIRRDVLDRNWKMVTLAKPKSKKELLLDRAREVNFREPFKGESVDDYERAIDSAGKRDVQQLFSLVGRIGK